MIDHMNIGIRNFKIEIKKILYTYNKNAKLGFIFKCKT